MMFTPGDKLEFGHYTILRELGSGGMGVVYHCRDEFLQRELAIKMLLPELMADDDTVEVFRQEARLAAQLEHPGIVTIYNIGMENREGKIHHYMAMEYLPGGSLRQRIGKEQISLEQAVEWMKELTTALHYAHKRGVVHQDIKPDNIFITQDSNAKIGDFGLALIATGVAFERAASGKGTPAYMSPELCRGEPRDHRSDIYSLGAVFFEMLTGQKPFKATGMIEMALKHATAPVPSAAELRKDLPPILDKAVRYMMAKSPDSRLQSLGDLLPSLDKLLLEMKVAKMGVGLRTDSQKAKAAAAAAEQAANEALTPSAPQTVAPQAAPPHMAAPPQAPAPQAAAPQTAAPPAVPQSAPERATPASATEVAPSARSSAFDFRPEPAVSQSTAAAMVAPAPKPTKVREAGPPDKEKKLDWLWAFKTRGPIGWSAAPVLNRGKKSLYVGSADGALYSLDMQSGCMLWHLKTEAPIVTACVFSGDKVFVPSSDGNLYCASAADGNQLWKTALSSPVLANPVLADSQIFVSTLDGSVKAVSTENGSITWTYRTDGELCSSPQVVESTVFVAGKDRQLHAIGSDKGWRKWQCELDATVLSECLASTDSVYCATTDGGVYCFDIVSGNRAWVYKSECEFLSKGTLEFTSVNFCSADGTLVCLDKYKGAPLWQVDTAGEVVAGLVSITGSLYVTCKNGVLQCFNARTGELKWYTRLDAELEGPPLPTSQAIYVGTVSGEVLALTPPK